MTGFFDKVSYSISLQELIDQGYLVPPVMTQIIKRGNTLPDIIGLTVNLYKQNESGKKAIVYMQQIEDCKLLRNAFQAAGVKCRAITSELTGEARDAVLMSFSKGSTQVLTTVNVLTAGFDSPNIEAIFQPYATSSPTQYLQRIGRGLRLCPEINKKHCNVYVYGDSPSISRQLYIKLQTRLLNAGGKIREFPTYEENLEYNEYDKGSEIYNWTSQIVHVVQHMRKMGMHSLADKLNHKDFPPKFLKDLSLFVKNLPKHKGNVGSAKTPITNKQLQVLVNNGFDNDYASSLTKNEASGMISTIFNMYNVKSDFIIPDGMHQGKHISELPFAYRRVILTKFPNSNVAKMLRQFYERKNNDQNHQR
jgi:superfamily II DNA or RNA helicase